MVSYYNLLYFLLFLLPSSNRHKAAALYDHDGTHIPPLTEKNQLATIHMWWNNVVVCV